MGRVGTAKGQGRGHSLLVRLTTKGCQPPAAQAGILLEGGWGRQWYNGLFCGFDGPAFSVIWKEAVTLIVRVRDHH